MLIIIKIIQGSTPVFTQPYSHRPRVRNQQPIAVCTYRGIVPRHQRKTATTKRWVNLQVTKWGKLETMATYCMIPFIEATGKSREQNPALGRQKLRRARHWTVLPHSNARILKCLYYGDSTGSTRIQDKVETTVGPAARFRRSAQGRCEQPQGLLLLRHAK